jgi:CRP-like cAMP-binding protein
MPSNLILSRLSRADLRLLEPHLEPEDLPIRKMLHARNKRIDHVYFPESGIASVVANGDHALEIGIIGREGMSGMSVIFGSKERATHDTYVQVTGSAHRLAVGHLEEAMDASAALHKTLLLAAHDFMSQMADTALANGRHKIEERLARWLLLVDDRVDDHEIPLTHEYLAVMLGTARPGVTIALQELERRGFIIHRRGTVTIIDRDGLVKSCNGAYVPRNGR